MNTRLRQIGALLRLDVISLVRFWYVSLFMVGMTTFYFLMLTRFADASMRHEVTLVFVILAVLSVALLHSGQRISSERFERWNPFLQTLPVPLWSRIAARLALVLMVGTLAAALIMVAGTVRFGLAYDVRTVVTALISVPFAVMVFAPLSACIGVWTRPHTSPVLTTVLFLTVAWSSGAWTRGHVPVVLTQVEFLLPVQAVQNLTSAATSAEWADMLTGLAVALVWAIPACLLAGWIHSRSDVT